METENRKNDDFSKINIGTKESSQTLLRKPVKVMGFKKENVTKKEDPNRVIGEKIILICKHPDREDPIEISKIKYLKGDKVVSSGLWFNLDADGLIPKQSALAEMLNRYSCYCIDELVGKELSTDLDGQYLVIKAY